MVQLFINGGFPMVGVVLCGLIAVVAAGLFARAPDVRKVGAVTCLSLATLASSLLGVVSDFTAVATHAHEFAKAEPENFAVIVLQGFGESMSPLIFGFAFLTAVWLVMAVGYRRLSARLPAPS